MSTSSSGGNVSLSAFPSDRRDALAILYLQNRDLSGKTPEEIADMYDEVWGRISNEFIEIQSRKHEERRKEKQNTSVFD